MPCLRALASRLAAAWLFLAHAVAPGVAGDTDLFERKIRPILVEHCHACHSATAEKLKAGLFLDSREGLLRGGESGPTITPGAPDRSLLLRAIGYEDPDLHMPPKTRLDARVVDDFRRWIQDGAAWPNATESTALTNSPGAKPATVSRPGFDLPGRKAAHWAWQPIRRPPLPAIRDTAWPRDDLDRFVLARLESVGLKPAPPAEPTVLARRTAFALTGLPPTADELASLERNPSPDAFGRQVDRWLHSPHYGERWARHWLDKIRYAETLGHEFDYPILGAWRYRDYVVRAFNADLPYSDFVREQIAGDLLPARRNPDDGSNESLLGTLQWWLPQQTHSPVDARAHTSEVIDNQIDVVSKAFLGLTVACARCHDHKFDAISTRDYYALHGILSSSRYAARDLAFDSETAEETAERLRLARSTLRRWLADRLLDTLTNGPSPSLAPPASDSGPSQLAPDEVRLPADAWFADGPAFTVDPQAVGEPAWLGRREIRLVAPDWKHSASLSRRFQGTLRTPTFTIDREFLHLRLAGRGARFGVAIEGFTLLRAPIYGALRQAVQRPEPHWVTLDMSMWKGRRAWIEFADHTAPDPASDLPPESRSGDGWIAVEQVVQSPRRDPPSLTAASVAPREAAAPADDLRQLASRWRDEPGSLTARQIARLEMAIQTLEIPESLWTAWATLESQIPPPVLAAGMTEGTGVDEPVFTRGNYRTPGTRVPRRFLEALPLGGLGETEFAQGSGRRALADALVHPDNPLPARVHVNWVWAHLFGRGLVASVDNFGVLGERPSHPELLDWLADEFTRSGGSTRALIRRIVLSRTWQMTSRIAEADPNAEQKDPDNVLLHRANLRRLEGEIVRDAMLAVAGRLDRTVGGPPVPVHLTPFMDGRGRPGQSGPLDGAGRRSLYLEVRRNFLSPFFLAFDAPVPATTVGRRSVSNVPAQALALMNDPFVVGQAKLWAARLALGAANDPGAAVDAAYLAAYARRPQADERAEALRFLAASGSDAGMDANVRLADLCHALFNAKEFVCVE